jgi:restriction system protein
LLNTKANTQVERWNEKWEKIQAKEQAAQQKEASIEEAENKTLEAQQKIEEIENLLQHTLSIDDTVNWEQLKEHKKFDEENPQHKLDEGLKSIKMPPLPNFIKISDPPMLQNYNPKFSFFDKIIKSKRESKIAESELAYNKDYKKWEESKKEFESKNDELNEKHRQEVKEWEELIENIKLENKKIVEQWKNREKEYYENQEKQNQKIDDLKDSYFNSKPEAIVENCELVLNNSEYPETFPKNFEIEYNPENKILIVDYSMPNKENLPTLKEVKYITSKKELKETHISESTLNKIYDDALYKITLRTIHELFEADAVNALEAICFNGWVNSVNPATGKEENKCILSIQAPKSEFMEVDLSRVEPKACFKQFKGVGSSKLSGLTPIAPILQLTKTDKRFVDSYDVAKDLDDSTNIAAMDWEDFEHLIRELFEKEFTQGGGEVKVTQASRDGGVDAIAFDPDPIRGGKIVIQAKRYTNVVGVSAVRDLYGTVMNEGATKGILVTTATYGSDAYEFAKGKPLALLSGSNLLHLLEKHGHKAKIDLKEAKKILSDKERESNK